MKDPVRIGSMIHRNRAAFAEIDECLSKIAEMMSHASGTRRRELRRVAVLARWTRVQIRIVGWVLRLIDPR